ncbi:MAG: anaerobic sulfatase maturase [Candidatus Dormibacteria bacterium]
MSASTTMPAPSVRVAEPFVVMAKPVGPVCNLDCGYCYYLRKRDLFPAGESFRMSHDVLEAYVRSFIESSPGPVVHFVWHGGEPMAAGLDFYRDAVALQERHLPPGWICLNNLQTNGSLLDDEWCAFLAERNFSVGLSLDGPARIHDAGRPDRRGRPTHQRVLRGLQLLRAHGVEPDVLCTLNARTATAPLEVYDFFLEQGVLWLQFLPVVVRDAAGDLSPWSVGAGAAGEFLCAVFDRWVRHDVDRIGIQNFLEALLVVAGAPANLCVMAPTCGRALVVEHDGGVYACDHFVEPARRLGDVRTDSLGALVSSRAQTAFGNAKQDALPAFCRSCPVLFLCRGGCPKDRFDTAPGGEPGLNHLCAGYRRFFEHALPHLERMADLAGTGQPLGAIMAELAGSRDR